MTDSKFTEREIKKEMDYTPKEKYSGMWIPQNREVRFNREIRGYRLTDDECQKLLEGSIIDFHLTSREGKPYEALGKLDDMEYDGYEYVGVRLIFVPLHWGGHALTFEERCDLVNGKSVRADDCVSKKTGRTYSVTLTMNQEDGKIEPTFG